MEVGEEDESHNVECGSRLAVQQGSSASVCSLVANQRRYITCRVEHFSSSHMQSDSTVNVHFASHCDVATNNLRANDILTHHGAETTFQ